MSGIVTAGRAAPDKLRAKLVALRDEVNALCRQPQTDDSLDEASSLLDRLASVAANAANQLTPDQSQAVAALTARVDDFIRR